MGREAMLTGQRPPLESFCWARTIASRSLPPALCRVCSSLVTLSGESCWKISRPRMKPLAMKVTRHMNSSATAPSPIRGRASAHPRLIFQDTCPAVSLKLSSTVLEEQTGEGKARCCGVKVRHYVL